MSATLLHRRRVESGDLLDNAPFREVVIRALRDTDLTWKKLARAVEVDEGTLRRSLGFRCHEMTRHIPYDLAVRLLRELGLDPVDFDV